MKKIALVLLAGFSIVSAKAQIQFGVKGGANFANLRISPKQDGLDFKSKVDFHGGAFVAIPLFDKFSLQPEAIYSGEGSKVTVSGSTGGKYNFSYVNIPVLFKYNDASGFFAETGPQIGFLLSAKAKEDGGTSQDIKDQVKSSNFAWALGIGYVLPANIGIDVRYNLGLSNIAKNSSSDGSLKTGNFQVGIFYLFGEGKKEKK